MVLDAVGNPQTILLLGGTSEIGLAICERYLRDAPARIILAALPGQIERPLQVKRLRDDRVCMQAKNLFGAVDAVQRAKPGVVGGDVVGRHAQRHQVFLHLRRLVVVLPAVVAADQDAVYLAGVVQRGRSPNA